MTSIIISGRPNSEEMSECIIVAENIANMYPSSRFTIVLKSPKEWEKYCEDLCNLFGILKKTHPLILFSNGKKIGGAQDFFKLISESFKYDKLVKKGNTVVVIEHNMDVIKCADYVIDMGPEGGRNGGEVVACGTPEEVAKAPKSITAGYIGSELARK